MNHDFDKILIEQARQDILAMYADLVRSYGGFGHNINVGNFDVFRLLDGPILEKAEIDVNFLRSGAAIALLCLLSDAWNEYKTADVPAWPIIPKIKTAYKAGKFDCIPEIKKAFELGFGNSETLFREQLRLVYEKFVVGYLTLNPAVTE